MRLLRKIPPRRLLAVLGAWAVLTGVAVGAAIALDDPVGAGERDAAQPAAVEVPEAAPMAGDDVAAPEGLPPLALVMEEPLPDDLAALDAREAAVRLRSRVAAGGTATEWVQLGSLLQGLDRGPMAARAYGAALQLRPGDVPAQVGLALADATTGPDGAARAEAELVRLARAHPRSQVVAFNRGWLAAYRRQVAAARAAWERTVALGPTTRLGRTAAALLGALENVPSGRNP